MVNFLNKFFPIISVCLIITASFVLMLSISFQESAIMDELAHIPAGYGYVKYLDYRLNPEHPPLVKALAAIPLLFQNLNFPIDKSSWQNDINGQWTAGAQFLYESGNDADKIIQWARLGPMFLTLILIVFIYIWARELMGRWWALLPTMFFAFSPTVLAHGHYVTTDIGAALGIFIASYYFIKFLFKPSGRHLVFAGLAFGVAQLLKFSAVLLVPFFVFLTIIFYIWKIISDGTAAVSKSKLKHFFLYAFRYFKALFLVFIIGYILVYVVYFLFTINYPIEKQTNDAKFILTSFANGPSPEGKICDLKHNKLRCLADINIILSQNRITQPLAQYLLGVLMVIQRSAGGNNGYFLGEVSSAGWWYYFPIVFLLKEPLPSLILIILGLSLALWRIVKKLKIKNLKFKIFGDYLGLHFPEFSMLTFTLFYWLYSINSPLNIGVRHILPTIPFIYILAVGSFKKVIPDFNNIIQPRIIIISLLIILIISFITEVLFAYPYYLSYFNQFGGGVWNGYKYVVDSNYDWGQDLKRLKIFVEENKIEKIAVDYFGGGDLKYYLKEKAEPWQSAKNNPKYYGINWLAISINNLQNALGNLHPGQFRKSEDEYQWLKAVRDPYKPDARVGTTIFIYKL